MSITFHVGDCVDVMHTFPSASFDCCIADPTYGDTSLSWDSVVDGWISELRRLLKPTACFWAFGSMRSLVRIFIEAEAAGFKYAQDIVWEKQNGTSFHADRFRRVHEHAVMFYRGPWADIYRQVQYTNDARARQTRRKQRPAHTGHVNESHYVSVDGGPRMVRSVIYARNEHGRALHPTQKPLDLLNYIARFSVKPGMRVLVPFSGSGSECIAARDAGAAEVIGIDNDAAMVEVARSRISLEHGPLFSEAAA